MPAKLKPPVARKLPVRHTSFVCLTTSYWILVVLSNYFTKFYDFSMIIQVFSNSMIFPCTELFWVIFHDFQSLWEPCDQNNLYKFWPTFHIKESPYEIGSSIGPVVSEKTVTPI